MELLAAILILGGTAGICWVLYGRGSGPTRCIGCGKCTADGRCILGRDGDEMECVAFALACDLLAMRTASGYYAY